MEEYYKVAAKFYMSLEYASVNDDTGNLSCFFYKNPSFDSSKIDYSKKFDYSEDDDDNKEPYNT